VTADGVGCTDVVGWAEATLRVKDDTQDVTYFSSHATLRFKPRDPEFQDMEGNTQYDLMPTSVIWTAEGTIFDCTIAGQILVNIPAFLNQPLDPTRPAWGYLNVVGLDGGDFHSVEVSAVNPEAAFTKTCPGDPPTVSKHFNPAAWLLHIVWEPNTYEGATVVFKGTQEFDLGKPLGFLKLLPPGADAAIPDQMRQALLRDSSPGKIQLYTWKWGLRPLTVGQTAGN
jgi:hypothetical protein